MRAPRVIAVALAVLPVAGYARSMGVCGRSGKQGATCQGCHAATGNAPTVSITGPDSVAPNSMTTYTFRIMNAAAPNTRAGMNAAVGPDGVGTLLPGTGLTQTAVLGTCGQQEVTHSTPLNFNTGVAQWTFTLVAPANAATLTLYACGNATNGSSTSAGDNAVCTTKMVTVAAPGMDGGTDAGAGGGDGQDAGAGGGAGGGGGGAGGGGGGTGGGAGGGSGGGAGGGGGSGPVGPPTTSGEPDGPKKGGGVVDGDVGCSSVGGLPKALLIGFVALLVLARAKARSAPSRARK